MKYCRASSIGVQEAKRGMIIGSSQVCSAAAARGACIGMLHAAAVVLLVLQSCHSQLGRHKQHAAYCCVIFILFDLFIVFVLFWPTAAESRVQQLQLSCGLKRSILEGQATQAQPLKYQCSSKRLISLQHRGSGSPMKRAVVAGEGSKSSWFLSKSVDESGLILGDNLALLSFQNKSRRLDAEMWPVIAGEGMCGRKGQPWWNLSLSVLLVNAGHKNETCCTRE